ncbi:hypothetical protein [Nonomuraea sp. KM90]|uniref:hypothetical protein n=1 Tax=Nonomuraea sp. KM90 TaxID=3457428 RepID=UPI003FCD10CE
MRMTVPSACKVTHYKSEDFLLVHTWAGCDRRKSVCPHFDIASPRKIDRPKDLNRIGETYDPGRPPYHPAPGATSCRLKSVNYGNEVALFPGSHGGKTLLSGHRQVGKGHKARYYEWAGEGYAIGSIA